MYYYQRENSQKIIFLKITNFKRINNNFNYEDCEQIKKIKNKNKNILFPFFYFN